MAELARRLSPQFSVEVITPKDVSLTIDPYQGNENYLCRRLYLDKTSLQIGKATKLILRKLSHYPPDIIYPVNNGWQSVLSKLFCLRHQTKLVLAGHSGPGWDDRVNLWLNPNAFIVFSKTQAEWAKRINHQTKIAIIPHGINLTQFKPIKNKLSFKLQTPIFVTVSALTQKGRAGETNKNILATIKAVARLPRGSLLLLGGGSDAARIDKLAESLLPVNRYHRLSVSHNIIQKYYQMADAFTLASSTSEAFGISFLEALACNLPVITLDDNLRHEIIGPAGVFIKDINDVGEYSRGLKRAVETNWGNIPRRQAEPYSWEKTAQMHINLFKELIIRK